METHSSFSHRQPAFNIQHSKLHNSKIGSPEHMTIIIIDEKFQDTNKKFHIVFFFVVVSNELRNIAKKVLSHMRKGQMFDLHDVHLHFNNSFENILVLQLSKEWNIAIYSV